MGIRVISTANAIAAAVAIYFSFGSPKPVKNTPKMPLSVFCGIYETINAPIRVRQTDGKPNLRSKFLSSPCLKKVILPRL